MNEIPKELLALKSDKYSPNLRKWLRKELDRLGEHVELVVVSREGRRRIGYFHEDDFVGADLPRVLNSGVRALKFCFVEAKLHGYQADPEFWEKYRELGKCHLDPAHSWYNERWIQTGAKSRQCRWCGRRHRLYSVVEKSEVWREVKTTTNGHK